MVLLLLLPPVLLAAEVRPFVSGSMAAITARQADEPLIVSFWSIDCPPCYKELDLWRALSRRYPALDLVLVSTDAPAAGAEVNRVLRQRGVAHLESWQFAISEVQRLRYEIDRRWYGELPRSYFFSPDGDVSAVSGVIDDEQVDAWLAQYYPATD